MNSYINYDDYDVIVQRLRRFNPDDMVKNHAIASAIQDTRSYIASNNLKVFYKITGTGRNKKPAVITDKQFHIAKINTSNLGVRGIYADYFARWYNTGTSTHDVMYSLKLYNGRNDTVRKKSTNYRSRGSMFDGNESNISQYYANRLMHYCDIYMNRNF